MPSVVVKTVRPKSNITTVVQNAVCAIEKEVVNRKCDAIFLKSKNESSTSATAMAADLVEAHLRHRKMIPRFVMRKDEFVADPVLGTRVFGALFFMVGQVPKDLFAYVQSDAHNRQNMTELRAMGVLPPPQGKRGRKPRAYHEAVQRAREQLLQHAIEQIDESKEEPEIGGVAYPDVPSAVAAAMSSHRMSRSATKSKLDHKDNAQNYNDNNSYDQQYNPGTFCAPVAAMPNWGQAFGELFHSENAANMGQSYPAFYAQPQAPSHMYGPSFDFLAAPTAMDFSSQSQMQSNNLRPMNMMRPMYVQQIHTNQPNHRQQAPMVHEQMNSEVNDKATLA